MQLEAQALSALATGAVRTETDADGYLRFHRFTEKTEDFYRGFAPGDRDIEALGTAGVCLHFTTDATALSLSYLVKPVTDRLFSFLDITVDGVLAASPVYGTADPRGTLSLELGNTQKTRTVCLYFTGLHALYVKDLTLTDATFCTPVRRARKLYCLGDSITHGYDACHPMNAYPCRLADMLQAELLNQGVGGEVFRPDMLDKDLPFAPDIITVAYGTNDWNSRRRETFTAAANEFYSRLHAYFPKAKIFAVTPIWRGDCDRVTRTGTFAEAAGIVRAAAEKERGVTVLDGLTLVPHLPACFAPDGLHPSDAGFAHYAEGLYRAITPCLD